MNKSKIFSNGFILLVLYVIIYVYFYNFKTDTIFGDDLVLYRDNYDSKSVVDIISIAKINEKFRPIWGIVLHFMFNVFHKKIFLCYLFNVGIQATNAFILTLIINFFFKSHFFSTFLSLIYALSRFAFYNMTQIYCGGALEGLAIVFFLLSLYQIIRFFIEDENSARQNYVRLLLAIIFINLSMYTHERYIVVFPFVILIALFYPVKNKLQTKQKLIIILLSVLSIILNVGIKKYIYHYSFFVGTGGTGSQQIHIAFDLIRKFLSEGLQSIIQLNIGAESIDGVSYNSLDRPYQAIIITTVIVLLITLILYVINLRKYFKNEQEKGIRSLRMIMFLLILFALLLIPAIISTRLEQRWLQASYSIFILIFFIAFYNINTKRTALKKIFFCLFIVLFIFSDYNYLIKSESGLFMKKEENIANVFKQAISNGTIPQKINNIYIEEQYFGNIYYEGNIMWALADGYSFDYYNGKVKGVFFIDGSKFKDNRQIYYLRDFNKETYEIITVGEKVDKVIDITDQYAEDRLKILNVGTKKS